MIGKQLYIIEFPNLEAGSYTVECWEIIANILQKNI